jgi:hypothetical protein
MEEENLESCKKEKKAAKSKDSKLLLAPDHTAAKTELGFVISRTLRNVPGL